MVYKINNTLINKINRNKSKTSMQTESTYSHINRLSLKNELIRKLVHMSSIIYPIIYTKTSKYEFILILLPIVLLCVTWDVLRINGIELLSITNKILREKEKTTKKLTGASFFLISILIVVVFFSKDIAILSIIILVIGDTFAAIVGRIFPIVKINYLKKSLGGFLGFITSSILFAHLYYVIMEKDIIKGLYISIVACSISELFAKKIKLDDNLIIPLTCAISLSIVDYISSFLSFTI